MYRDCRCARTYSLVVEAEVEGVPGVRSDPVCDLRLVGTYLGMADLFSKGPSVRIKIRTGAFELTLLLCIQRTDYQTDVTFHGVSPPFQIVVQRWLSEAQQ